MGVWGQCSWNLPPERYLNFGSKPPKIMINIVFQVVVPCSPKRTLSCSSIPIGSCDKIGWFPLLEVSLNSMTFLGNLHPVNEICRLGSQNTHHTAMRWIDWLCLEQIPVSSVFAQLWRTRIRSISLPLLASCSHHPIHHSLCMKAHGSSGVIERGKYRACPVHLSSLFTSSGTHASGTEKAFLAENTDLDSCSPLYLSLSSEFNQPRKPVQPRSASTMLGFCYVHDSFFP